MGVVRLSLGWSTTEAEVDAAAEHLAGALDRLKALAPFERRRPVFAARAAEAALTLTPAHWDAAEAVFAFHRQNGVLPGARFLPRALGRAPHLERLFPQGMASVATWLAIPVPQGGCRPGI